MQRRAYKLRERVASEAGATSADLVYGPVRDGRVATITRVAIENETSTPTGAARLLVRGHGYDHYLDEVPAPAVDRLYVFTDLIELSAGESLVVAWAGLTLNDKIRMYVDGSYDEDQPPKEQ